MPAPKPPLTTATLAAASVPSQAFGPDQEALRARVILDLVRESLTAPELVPFLFAQEPRPGMNAVAVVHFLRHVRQDSWKTIEAYAVHLCQFLNLRRKPFSAIAPGDVQAYLDWLEAKAVAPATINAKLASLRSFYGYCEAFGHVATNPTRHFAFRKATRLTGHQTKILDQAQVRELVRGMLAQKAPARDVVLLEVLFFCGLRAAEAQGLTWSDLVRRPTKKDWVWRVLGKGSKERLVHVPTFLMDHLMRYRQLAFGAGPFEPAPGLSGLPVFPSRQSGHAALSVRSIQRLAEAWSLRVLGTRITPHWGRHSCATNLRGLGVPLDHLRDLLGHASVMTTERYERSEKDSANAAYDALDPLLDLEDSHAEDTPAE